MLPIEEFFEHLEEFDHHDLFQDVQNIWDPLNNLEESIFKILSNVASQKDHHDRHEGLLAKNFHAWEGEVRELCLFVQDWIEVTIPLYFEKLKIFIHDGSLLEPGAIIKGPAVIGPKCEVRQGAYIRGNVLVGNRTVIGHSTEVKNSIIMNHTAAGHFNYIGDSIIGSYVNLGAGAKLANLQLRSAEEKREGFICPIKINHDDQVFNTELEKLGTIMGDYVELGCNSVTCPGALIAKRNWVYPNTTLPKGFYPPNHFISPQSRQIKTQNI